MIAVLNSTPALVALGVFAFLLLMFAGDGFVYISNDRYGVVERRWSFRAAKKRMGFMAVNGGAGFLPDTIKGGWHVFIPFQDKVHRQRLITVRNIGYLFARNGAALAEGQALAAWPPDTDPSDAAAFLANGGQAGPQRRILRAATYAINTALFVVLTDDGAHQIPLGDDDKIGALHALITGRHGYDPVVIDSDRIAVVTVQDGPALEHGEIIAPTVGTDARVRRDVPQLVPGYSAFPGRRRPARAPGTGAGRRHLLHKPPVRHDGVAGQDADRHRPCRRGHQLHRPARRRHFRRGLPPRPTRRSRASAAYGRIPLQPGKYAINPFAQDVKLVPTTNFQLRWIQDLPTDVHNFDANLSEIRLITRDAFEPLLPLSIVVHIAQDDAPFVVQQFAEIGRLVDQTLDPMVSAWFKDAAQEMTLIELVSRRSELQAKALGEMRVRFQKYRLNVMEVMIGTPRAAATDKHIDTVFEQLRVRQVAREQATTYASQQEAALKERELNEARAIAAQQTALTASKVAIDVALNEGQAQLQRRGREAEGIKITAAAEAERTRLTAVAEADRIRAIGDAEAARTRMVGEAEATASKAQSDALGGPDAALRRLVAQLMAQAMQHASQPLVPGIVVGEGHSSGILDALMALVVGKGSAG